MGDDDFAKVKETSNSCLALLCADISCNTSPCSPGAFGHANVCCCHLALKADSNVMCGEEGCLSIMAKACCCAVVATTKNCPVIGACDYFPMGSPLGEGVKAPLDGDVEYLNDMFWCLYLCIAGFGITKSMEPICSTGTTLCCLEASSWCDTGCCPEGQGCVSVALKLWCCAVLARIPPSGSDIGLGACGIYCITPADGRERSGVENSPYLDIYEPLPAQQRM